MIEHRPLSTLGGGDRGWLKAKLHFDFGGLGNPAHGPIGSLLVWNDDEVAPHSGFGMHAHRDMEIVTFVRDGAITHTDSLGNAGRTEAGDVQVMSAGAGIRHSEMNDGDTPARLFQIWLRPRTLGGPPRWANRHFPREDRAGRLVVLASGDPADDGALAFNAEARVLGATLRAGESVVHALPPGRQAYLVTTRGRVTLDGIDMQPRDGAAIQEQPALSVVAIEDTELVLVEVN